jgi:hypothetical protein
MAAGLAPVADQLTRLPAGKMHPGMNAGPSFQMFRSTQLLPHKDAAWTVLRERLQNLATYCQRLGDELSSEQLAMTVGILRSSAEKLVPDTA